MAYKPKTLVVPAGGTASTSFTAYTPLCGGTTSTLAIQSVSSTGTAGQALTSNGASTLPTFQDQSSGGGGGSSSTFNTWNDFTAGDIFTSVGFTGPVEYPYSSFVSGTGSSINNIPALNTNPGLLQYSTGTTSTGHAAIFDYYTNFLFGAGTYECEFLINVPVLSTPSERFTIIVGYGSYNQTGTFANGAYFVYSDNLNSGQWQIKTADNSVRGTQNTTTALVAGAWTKLKVAVNADATAVNYYIDDVLVPEGPLTSNIPTATGKEVSSLAMITKSVGSTARTMTIDYISQNITLTTAR